MHGEDPHGHSCEECHREHGNGPHKERQVLTAAALPAVDSQGKLAMTGILGCPSCHDPHENSAPLLRRGTPAAVCVACHQDKAALAGSSHDTDTPGESLCKPCHPSHGEASAPTGDDPAAARCTGCHLEDRLITQGHSRQGTPPWRQLTAELPLFDQAGERNPYGFISCPTCHDVHTSAERRSMRADEHDPPHLCLGCHQEKVSLLGSSHDPRQSGSETTCTACHPLHPEQDGPGAWTFGEDAQGTWNDRKCTPCHSAPENNPWGYTDTTSHPVNVLLPQRMGSGELPLFDALGGTMGRVVACTTCHDLHGTPAGPETTIPYFLRLDPSSGGLCITCHKDAGSVIGTAHDVGGDPDPLGPCSPCHVAHGATSARALWWMEPAPGEYEPNRLCRSCHRAGGSAEGEYLLMQYHMKDAEEVRSPRGTIYLQRPMLILDELALRSGNEPIIPLFQRDGTAGPSGNLQCVSCHEPHQWSPMGAFVKPGFGTLGPNVPTMFLRLGDPKKAKLSVCAVCHPDDAERRYMEYHRVWSDVGATFQ
jgi:predicted CXXCH cytochrome family protein